jgi:hypothetical protein
MVKLLFFGWPRMCMIFDSYIPDNVSCLARCWKKRLSGNHLAAIFGKTARHDRLI